MMLRRAALACRSEPIEFVCGLVALLYGLALPALAAALAQPRGPWADVGWLYVATGGAQIVAVLTGGTGIRRVAAMVGVVLWTFTALLFLLTGPGWPLVIMPAALTVGAAASYVRVSLERTWPNRG
jgi:hypothetical protein